MSEVASNMIVANYGASQGFDTDDGTSWYAFHDNLIYVEGKDGQNCINTQSFLPGHGSKWFGNKCVLADSKNIGSTSGCDCPGKTTTRAASLGGSVLPPASECG